MDFLTESYSNRIKIEKRKLKVKTIILNVFLIFLLLTSLSIENYCQGKKSKQQNGMQTAGSPGYSKINVGNVSTFVHNNGFTDITPTNDPGFVYPIRSGKTALYQSGLVWGGKINGVWSVGGTTGRTGLKPGRILSGNVAEDLSLANVRIYRVRSDYKNFNTPEEKQSLFAREIQEQGFTAEQIFDFYDKDWKEWPASSGAPFKDVDNNGFYNPDVDIPGYPGACQTIWYAANDLDVSAAAYLYGALPMGIEMQATFWAYRELGAWDNTIFRKYKVINKNSNAIDSMYFCMWADPDVGGAFDDFVGCDTVRQMMYAYNAIATDDVYSTTPPAVGFSLLKSPEVNGAQIGMTSFFMTTQGNTSWGDPTPGNYNAGAMRMKNLFEGKMCTTGLPYIDPNNNKKTKFPLSGDPVARTGWVDGQVVAKNDRRMGMVSGPISLPAGSSQEIAYAQIAAGAEPGVNFLSAISVLRFYNNTAHFAVTESESKLNEPTNLKAEAVDNQIWVTWQDNSFQESGYTVERSEGSNTNFVAIGSLAANAHGLIDNNVRNGITYYYRVFGYMGNIHSSYSTEVSISAVVVGVEKNSREIPKDFVLYQNYPNPFNPSTKIQFGIPEESKVTIDVFNSIGQKIETISNDIKNAGTHSVNFNGKSLASGVYYYKMTAVPVDGGKIYNSTSRMVLIK